MSLNFYRYEQVVFYISKLGQPVAEFVWIWNKS